MLDMLRDHSNNAHSARLEWCVSAAECLPIALDTTGSLVRNVARV